MTGESHDFGARLRELVIAGDLAELRSYLDELAGDDLRAARAWVRGTHDVDTYPYPAELGENVIAGDGDLAVVRVDVGRPARERAMRRARLLTFARLAGPAAAAKAVGSRHGWWDDVDSLELVAGFVDHDRAWAAAFAVAADAVPPSARGAGMAVVLLRAVVEAHGLPVPTGRNFHRAWINQVESHAAPPTWAGPRTPTLEPLLADPLLPDVVYHQLASGEVGGWTGFGTVLPPLVEQELIDRDRTLAIALAQLTAGQRPSSQKALAGVLTALDLRAGEVPGGLNFLYNVLSTCHSSVVGVALGLALELVSTDAEVVELARVMAPRSEKTHRRRLLGALSPERLGRLAALDSLLEAIDALADSDHDPTERARYDQARLAVGAPPAPAPDEATALGLWDLQLPTPPPPAPWNPWRPGLRDRLWASLRTGASATDDTGIAADLLVALARGQLTADELAAAAHELAVEGRLSPTRAAGVLESLFLGGAMRTTWPAALEIADLCAAAPRTAPGLDRLLRFLATYAVEVPRPSDLPAHLVELAGGRSKAAQEAARLATLLGASREPGTPARALLGLWTERNERGPWGLAYPLTRDLGTIGARVASWAVSFHQVSGTVRRTVLTSLLLDELAALVGDHGAQAVRDAFGDGSALRGQGLFAEAVALWAHGGLTTQTYWALARSTTSAEDLLPRWREEMGPMEASHRFFAWTVQDGLESTPPVMPRWWSDGSSGKHARLMFLHACEVLLVAERGGRVVSTTDVSDGSLGLDHLWERLAVAPRVGPLDLRLALGRLRPAPAGVPPGTAVAAVLDPALSSADASRHDRASDIVQRWVDGGGLRLSPRRTDDGWAYGAECPVPWDWCEAMAGRAFGDGPQRDDAFLVPGRPDVCLRHGITVLNRDDTVADVGGPIGEDGWRTILTALDGPAATVHHAPDFGTLVRLQDQGRLDPAVATAAASSRWDEGEPGPAVGALEWERAMLRGALRGLWPVAAGIVEAGLARPERPAGVDELIEVMRRRVHEVPADAVPSWLARA